MELNRRPRTCAYVLSFERFISLETSRPIAIDFIAIIIEVGEMLNQILGPIGSMATESSLRVIMGKTMSPLLWWFLYVQITRTCITLTCIRILARSHNLRR